MPTTTQRQPTQEEISARAHRYYQEAGAPNGRDDEFWLRAERDLQDELNSETEASPQTESAAARKNGGKRKG
jgi:hypothetical protein